MSAKNLLLLALSLTFALAAGSGRAGETRPMLPELPEGDGIAAKYPGDQGMKKFLIAAGAVPIVVILALPHFTDREVNELNDEARARGIISAPGHARDPLNEIVRRSESSLHPIEKIDHLVLGFHRNGHGP